MLSCRKLVALVGRPCSSPSGADRVDDGEGDVVRSAASWLGEDEESEAHTTGVSIGLSSSWSRSDGDAIRRALRYLRRDGFRGRQILKAPFMALVIGVSVHAAQGLRDRRADVAASHGLRSQAIVGGRVKRCLPSRRSSVDTKASSEGKMSPLSRAPATGTRPDTSEIKAFLVGGGIAVAVGGGLPDPRRRHAGLQHHHPGGTGQARGKP